MVYWAGRDLGQKLCWAFNDAVVEAHEAHPDRLIGFAVLPMHEPDLAVQELDRIAKLPGMRGVYVATRVLDRELSDEAWITYLQGESYAPLIRASPVGQPPISRHFLSN